MEIIISEYSLNIAASQGLYHVKDTFRSYSQLREDKHEATLPCPALLFPQTTGLL